MNGINVKIGSSTFHASKGQKKIVEIDLLHLEEGIRYVKSEEIYSIKITNSSDSKEPFDFSLFKDFSDLEVLLISFDVPTTRIKHIDYLYSLNINNLVLNKFDAYIEYGKLQNLKSLYLHITKHNTLDSLPPQLKILTIQGWKDPDLSGLPRTSGLELLILNLCRLESLNGIESFFKLADLRLYGCHQLEDLEALNQLSESLSNLEFEACKRINSQQLSVLKLNQLERLSVLLSLDDIHFVGNFPALKRLGFRSVEDGDLNAIVNHPSMTGVGFPGNKKHYSHTREELNGLLG